MALRDWDVLDDVNTKLKATGEFDGVYRGALPEARGQAAADKYAAAVSLLDWEETDLSDDAAGVQSTRTVRWQLTLMVREDDPELRERSLDRLLNVCQVTLDGQSLAGGLTIPDWTRLRKGAYQKAEPPQQAMVVTGEFAYWVEGFAGHDVTP